MRPPAIYAESHHYPTTPPSRTTGTRSSSSMHRAGRNRPHLARDSFAWFWLPRCPAPQRIHHGSVLSQRSKNARLWSSSHRPGADALYFSGVFRFPERRKS